MPTIIAGMIAGSIFLALRLLNILPTFRMILMFVMGTGLAIMIGGIFLWVWNWLGGATKGFLPWQVALAVGVIPTCVAIYGFIVCFYHLKPKEKPDKHVQWMAFTIPLALLLVTGGIVGTIGDKLTGGVTKGANNVNTELVGTGGSGPLPPAKKHGGK